MRSRLATWSGSRANRSVEPSPRGRKVSLVAAWARRSSATSRAYSAWSAMSGAMASSSRSPRRRSSRGPNWAACSTRCFSPRSRSPGSNVGGRSSSAVTMTWAWATLTRPSASAAPTCRQRLVDRGCEPGGPEHGAVVVAGGVGQPGGGGPGAGLDGDVVGCSEHPQLEGLHPVGHPGQLDEGGLLLLGGHEHRLHASDLVERRADGVDAAQHRMRTGVGERRHGSSQASTTDTRSVRPQAQKPLFTRGLSIVTRS